ncbi:MAG: MgtC/SapB family protein [Nanoarchaeota archaeon]|nr:MgtC/SapB family protein [Nanoarchaeota archaeon]MBU4242384.1 MgtC/SapB family protein [Nanoarchaeota archaeon]MBU4352785.1 MgtC/SapB family protein [Nanoarchaeota archaeon]MCG2719940.1 MgtC/SapB family protein [Nanoarchaeota archaeon]
MEEVLTFFIAILLGALIGLQREFEQQHTHIKRFAGLRTFIIITLMGAILGYISQNKLDNLLLVTVGLISITAFAIISYITAFKKYQITSATTELAAMMAYIIGVMCTIGFLIQAVIFAILTAAFLTYKERLHSFAKKLKKQELFAIVEFAIIALVVLPLLPKNNFSPMDVPILKDILLSTPLNPALLQQLNVFNLYNMWLMVILVAGISFLGYIFVKFLGQKKGYGLTGFVGGLISSTAVTISMAHESKRFKKILAPFVIAVVVATSTSFFRILIEVIVVNNKLLLPLLIPMSLMALSGLILIYALFKKTTKKNVKEIEFKQPFALGPAIKFGLFFTFIIFLSKVMHLLAGTAGLYITSIVSGFADVDAITLTMASLSKMGDISVKVAVTSIILAASSNTVVKAGMAYFWGEKKFAKYIMGIFAVMLVLGLLVVFLL